MEASVTTTSVTPTDPMMSSTDATIFVGAMVVAIVTFIVGFIVIMILERTLCYRRNRVDAEFEHAMRILVEPIPVPVPPRYDTISIRTLVPGYDAEDGGGRDNGTRVSPATAHHASTSHIHTNTPERLVVESIVIEQVPSPRSPSSSRSTVRRRMSHGQVSTDTEHHLAQGQHLLGLVPEDAHGWEWGVHVQGAQDVQGTGTQPQSSSSIRSEPPPYSATPE